MLFEHKDRTKEVLGLTILVFILAFCLQLFLTYGFDFFWEDLDVFHVYREKSAELQSFKEKYLPESIQPSRFTLILSIGKEFVKKFFAAGRLFQIGFNSYGITDRPYQFLTWDLMKIFFLNNVILYRILVAIIFAINTCIIFVLINRVSRLLALLGVFLYMTSAEIWLTALYLTNPSLLVQCGVILSVLLFIKLIEKEHLRYKDTLVFYFLILVISNYSILTMVDGRYLAVIFLLTILFFQRKSIRYHLPMLFILLLMEIPVLGFIKKIFFQHSFSPINFASHECYNASLFNSLRTIIINYKFARNAVGSFILTILYITITAHLIYFISRFIFRKNSTATDKTELSIHNHKTHLFLFLLWFAASLTMSVMARKLKYDGAFSLQLADLSFFVAPSIIFSCYYVALISRRIRKLYRVVFLSLCLCLMSVQILHNIDRLNKFRGGWGNYFIGWQNAKKYIDETNNNALALAFTTMHHKPFLFPNSNNKIINTQESYQTSPFCDLRFIEEKFEEGFDDVFVVAARHELDFRGSSKKVILKQTLRIDGDSRDLYDRLKRLIGRPSKPETYMYHFRDSKKTNKNNSIREKN